MTNHTRHNIRFALAGCLLLAMTLDCTPSGQRGSGFLACVPERERQPTTVGYVCDDDEDCEGLVCLVGRCRVPCDERAPCDEGICIDGGCHE